MSLQVPIGKRARDRGSPGSTKPIRPSLPGSNKGRQTSPFTGRRRGMVALYAERYSDGAFAELPALLPDRGHGAPFGRPWLRPLHHVSVGAGIRVDAGQDHHGLTAERLALPDHGVIGPAKYGLTFGAAWTGLQEPSPRQADTHAQSFTSDTLIPYASWPLWSFRVVSSPWFPDPAAQP